MITDPEPILLLIIRSPVLYITLSGAVVEVLFPEFISEKYQSIVAVLVTVCHEVKGPETNA